MPRKTPISLSTPPPLPAHEYGRGMAPASHPALPFAATVDRQNELARQLVVSLNDWAEILNRVKRGETVPGRMFHSALEALEASLAPANVDIGAPRRSEISALIRTEREPFRTEEGKKRDVSPEKAGGILQRLIRGGCRVDFQPADPKSGLAPSDVLRLLREAPLSPRRPPPPGLRRSGSIRRSVPIPASGIFEKGVRLFGAVDVSLDWQESPAALTTGVVDNLVEALGPRESLDISVKGGLAEQQLPKTRSPQTTRYQGIDRTTGALRERRHVTITSEKDGSIERSARIVESHIQDLEHLAEGGAGHVYKGTEDVEFGRGFRTSLREVVVKVAKYVPEEKKEGESEKDRLKRREREEQALDAVRRTMYNSVRFLRDHAGSPRVVTVLEMGETYDPDSGVFLPYMVMEYMPDGTLAGLLHEMREGGTWNLETVLDWAIQVVAAVAEYHENGLVHRDIKSDNCLCHRKTSRDGKKKTVIKLCDDGLTRRTTDPVMPGLIQGTPGYISPERLDPNLKAKSAKEAMENNFEGPSADTFALGVLLYEMLTDRLPFLHDFLAAVDRDPGRIMEFPLRTLEEFDAGFPSPREIRPDRGISEVLSRIVMKALDRDPKKRHAVAGELLFELVTHRATMFREAADQAQRDIFEAIARGRGNGAQMTHWQERDRNLRMARHYYQRALLAFPDDERTKKALVKVLAQLHERAIDEMDGLDRWELDATLGDLEPDHEAINRKIDLTFYLDEKAIGFLKEHAEVPAESQVQIRIVAFKDSDGVLEIDEHVEPQPVPMPFSLGAGKRPEVRIQLDPWVSYGVLVTGRGGDSGDRIKDYFLPLPCRPDDYEVRLSLFEKNEFRQGSTLVLAGEAPPLDHYRSRMEPLPRDKGPRAEMDLEVWRPTWGDLMQILSESCIPSEIEEVFLPAGWKLGEEDGKTHLKNGDGEAVDPDNHVAGMQPSAIRRLCEILSEGASSQRRQWRLATVPEQRRISLGGVDRRPFSWGDGLPDRGDKLRMACRLPGHPALPGPLSINAEIADRSPFTPHLSQARFGPLDIGALVHMCGNLGGMVLDSLENGAIQVWGVAFDERAPTVADDVIDLAKASLDKTGFILVRPISGPEAATPRLRRAEDSIPASDATEFLDLSGDL